MDILQAVQTVSEQGRNEKGILYMCSLIRKHIRTLFKASKNLLTASRYAFKELLKAQALPQAPQGPTQAIYGFTQAPEPLQDLTEALDVSLEPFKTYLSH